MASVARAIEQAASCTVDENLWWDSHESLFHYLDDYLSGFKKLPSKDVLEKLQANRVWLLESLLQFKVPNEKSKSALDVAQVVIGKHTLEVDQEIKGLALNVSKKLALDEVQAYILVSRSMEDVRLVGLDSFQKTILKYYTERQCLLKCVRLILLCCMGEPSDDFVAEPIDSMINLLIEGGLQNKSFMLLKKLLSVDQPLDWDLTLMNLWAEQIAMEENMVLDIIFLVYYKPLCSCDFVRWKELFSLFQDYIFDGTSVERLCLTAEAKDLVDHIKNQAVLIILETLDLDKLLLMVFDDVPFSEDRLPFSVQELLQADGTFGKLNPMDVREYAPLLLGWGTFGCLMSFIPSSDKGSLDIDHTSYIQQAHEYGAFQCLLDMAHHKGIQDSNIDGYKYVIKSIVSSFCAAFDVTSQGDSRVMQILVDVICSIYSGQEVLCVEFWDRDSILDSPLRNLLCSLRESFPYELKPMVQLLAGLAEGPWPAECVYSFLYRPEEIACLFQERSIQSTMDNQFITAPMALEVPGASGLFIPAGTIGQLLKTTENQTNVVLWKCKHSAIVILLLRLTGLSITGGSLSEVHAILNLFHRLFHSNKMLAELVLDLDNSEICREAQADGRMEVATNINILSITCRLLEKLVDVPGNKSTAALCMDILSIFAGCCPLKVMFEFNNTPLNWSTGNFLDGGLLAKSLSSMHRDSEGSDRLHPLVISVLDLCTSLIAKGLISENLSKTVLFVIGTLFVNHMTWKYGQKHERWKITTKVLELALSVLSSSQPAFVQLKNKVMELITVDVSFQTSILRIVSIPVHDLQGLYFNRFADLREIDWFEKALCSGLNLLNQVLSVLLSSFPSSDTKSITPLEHALLHHTVGTTPFVACVASLTSLFQNQTLQSASLKMLTTLCNVASKARPHPLDISSYIQDYDQKASIMSTFRKLLSKETAELNTDLFNLSMDFLIGAVRWQPSIIDMLFSPLKHSGELTNSFKDKGGINKTSTLHQDSSETVKEALWETLIQGQSVFKSNPHILCSLLLLLKCLWEGGAEFTRAVDYFREREGFWDILTSCLSNMNDILEANISSDKVLMRSFHYQCLTYALQILSWDLFLQHFAMLQNEAIAKPGNADKEVDITASKPDNRFENIFRKLIKAVNPAKLIKRLSACQFDKSILSRARVEMRALLVGLLLKMSTKDELGLSAPLVNFLQDIMKRVVDHSSFQGLLRNYLSHGYGCGAELQALVMNDLYFHLQGELEAGRNIPAGSFEDLVDFLDTIELTPFTYSGRVKQVDKIESLHDTGFLYNTTQLRKHLGMEWWSQNVPNITQAAENTLETLQRANMMACLGDCQISSLEALSNLLSVIVNSKLDKSQVFGDSTDACILELCDSVESSIAHLTPDRDPTHYIDGLLTCQSKLLLVLVRWISICMVGASSKRQSVCTRVISVLSGLMHCIWSSQSAMKSMHSEQIKSVLEAYLCCLEIMKEANHGAIIIGDNVNDPEPDSSASDLLVVNPDFLSGLCALMQEKIHANLAMAIICLIMKHFLAPPIWVPILAKHSTVHFCLSLLHVSEEEETLRMALNLLLCISHSRNGGEMLQSAGVFSHILSFMARINKDNSVGDQAEGPFSVWNAKSQKNDLWSLSVALVAAVVHSLGVEYSGSAVESAFVFFELQNERILSALQSPYAPEADGIKRTKLGRAETTLSALQETKHVLHFMIILQRHNAQWLHAMGRSEVDVRHKCIHLLAYIAREGLMRNMSTGLRCPPVDKEEIVYHRKSSLLGSNSGWFGLAVKGSYANNKFTNFSLDLSIKRTTEKSTDYDKTALIPTHYSDSVALYVYQIALLLLVFLCKQAHYAVSVIDEGGTFNQNIFPEFPAPEILYGLQDQAMAVICDICATKSLKPEAQDATVLMINILERSLYLEVCLSRICGVMPLSVRLEDFTKEFKRLLVAVEGHSYLDKPLQSLKSIVGLSYPSLF